MEMGVDILLRGPVVGVLNHLARVDCCVRPVPDADGANRLIDRNGPINVKGSYSHDHQHEGEDEPLAFVNDSQVVQKMDFRSFHWAHLISPQGMDLSMQDQFQKTNFSVCALL
jgi:hypothetical protein